VTLKQAQAELNALALQLSREIPVDLDHGQPWNMTMQPIRDALFGFMSKPLILLQGAVGLVLLIACANVAGLLLARATSRRTEVAIRSALGAARIRIVRQFLTESILLAIAGGVLGLFLAWWGVHTLVAMAPPFFPRLGEVALNSRVLLFSAAISLLTGIFFGMVPAIQGSHANYAAALKDAMRGGTSGGARHRLRGALVAGQLALALVLLIGSGLLVRSFLKLQGADLGCDPRNLLTFTVRLPIFQFAKPTVPYHGLVLWEVNDAGNVAMRRIFEGLRNVPGAESVGGATLPPLIGGDPMPFEIPGHPAADPDAQTALYQPVTPGYFQTIKAPLQRGRDFTLHDLPDSPWVAVINETMARRYWPNEDAMGKFIRLDMSPEDQPREIVGVVHDIPSNPQQARQDPIMYVPYFQMASHCTGPWNGYRFMLTMIMRTKGNPMKLVPAAQRALAGIDPNRPMSSIKTEEEQIALQVQYPRYYSLLLGLFAAVATILAAIGIYGVMAYAVEQRTREIGIRIALGAGGWDVLRLVFRQVAWLLGIGLVAGIGGALALTKYISSELWEVRTTDPPTLTAVSILLVAVAIVACIVPTRRAVKVDPTVALRYE
jgi:putative ABC transport system permease protein